MVFGFEKVAAAIPTVRVADLAYNCQHIADMVHRAAEKGVRVVAFPELSLTGYTCGDLFSQSILRQEVEKYLGRLVAATADCPTVVVVGMPVSLENHLYNCAVVFSGGKIHGVVPKTYLPNYDEFYEARWFASGADGSARSMRLCGSEVPFGRDLLFRAGSLCIGVEVCEDLWVPIPPSSYQALGGATVLVNLSASNEMVGKYRYLRSLIAQQSARTVSAYIYASAGFGESSTDLVFAGKGIIAENGSIICDTERFSMEERMAVCEIDTEQIAFAREKKNTFTNVNGQPAFRTVEISPDDDPREYPFLRTFDTHPFLPAEEERWEQCEEVLNIQASGLAQRLIHTSTKKVVLGISGGLDSTLALMVCIRTFDMLGLDRKGIVAVTMPGFGTSSRTHANALALMQKLGVTMREINIQDACIQHFKDLAFDPATRGATYENTQARERTQILMDIANQVDGLVVGTGDLSELALGWATYNGDHMSMYGINGSVSKTLVRLLVQYLAESGHYPEVSAELLDVGNTPVSPELLPAAEDGSIAQITEDVVGPYELHDFFLYNMIRYGFRPAKLCFMAEIAFRESYDRETIKKWLKVFMRRFFSQQFKRSALPDGPKVGAVSLSPRGDWRMPSDASAALWLSEIDAL